jgi:transcriptional regulator with XRE-family HTH domain
MSHFSNTFTGLVKARKLGYEKLAAEVKLSSVFVWRLMVGQKNPSLATLYRIAQALAQVEREDGGNDGELFPLLLTAALKDDLARDKKQRKRQDA